MSPRQPDFDPTAVGELATRLLGFGTMAARVQEGVSTPVYRLVRGEETFYLRASETPEASMAPEVAVHAVLGAAGVALPEVVTYDPFAPEIGRSIMVVRQVPGKPLSNAAERRQAEAVATEAGRQLATINQVVVDGFGWITRGPVPVWPLQGELASQRHFVLSDLDERGEVLAGLTVGERDGVEAAIDGELDHTVHQGKLAHGDLDPTHIFHIASHLTGIIDLGEIRGTSWYYDLAHFYLRDGELLGFGLFGHLVHGYEEVTPLPGDVQALLRGAAILITVRELCRWHRRFGGQALASRLGRRRLWKLRQVLATSADRLAAPVRWRAEA